MKNIYIYKITNLKTNDIYIGIREIEGEVSRDKYKGEDTKLKKELNKYGKKAFITDVIAKDLSMEMAKTFLLEYKKHLKATVLEEVEENKRKKLPEKKSGFKKKVICLTNQKIFDSATEASRFYNLGRTSISKACCNRELFAGKDLETGEKLKWAYYDTYIAEQKGDEPPKPKEIAREYTSQKILCKTTGKIFNSAKEAHEFYEVSESAIYRCCAGRRNYAGLDPESGKKLAWSYID